MTDPGAPNRCKNCITLLPEGANYCPHCGQKQTGLKDHSIRHLIADSVGDFFHFDSKFFTTLTPLLFRPGFLTNEYLAGRRIRYFTPFKLFLFISFLFFLISGIFNHARESDDFEIASPQYKTDTVKNVNTDGNFHLTLAGWEKVIAISDDSLRRMVKKDGLNRFVNQQYPEASWWEKFMIKQVVKDRLQESAGFKKNMGKTIPKLIFILIPIFALLLKAMYARKKILYFNHVIFSFHFLSFFFLMNLVREPAVLLTEWINLVFLLTILTYLFLSLQYVYAEKIRTTLRKFLVFSLGSLFIVAVFYIMAAMISFLMI